jgi:hypothetical protein
MASSRTLDAVRAMLAHPHRSKLSQRSHLGVRDRLKRMAKAEPTATLHLAEDQRQPGRAHPRHTQTKMITQPGHRHE